MLLGEPAPTQADLHFRLFGFPVRVHPLFWVVSLLLGLGGGPADPVDTLVWVGVVFISILVHEVGHAFLQRHYGGRPWITLYGMGGLASCNDCDRSPWKQIVISLAGPFAGFLLAMAVVVVLNLSGHVVGFSRTADAIPAESFSSSETLSVQPLGPFVAYFAPFASRLGNNVIGDLLYVNIMWGLINLLPIYPLDGGRISRELFSLRNTRSGTLQSLQLSAGAAILVAAYALLHHPPRVFTGIMFGFLAYENFQSMQFYRSHWR